MAGKVMDIEKRNEILNNGRRRLEAYENVIKEIEGGTPEAEACRKYNVALGVFRNFVRKDFEDNSEYKERDYEEYFTWQDELCAKIFGEKTTACIGFDEAYKYVRETLTDREVKVLDMRYKEGMTHSDVGKEFNVTSERIKQIENKAIRKLRHPRRAVILYYGLEYKRRIEEREKELEAVRDAELEQFLLERYGDGETTSTAFDTSIKELGLSVRAYNCLSRANINNLYELVKYSNERGMKNCRNLGRTVFNELVTKTEKYGITLHYNVE